MDFSSMNGWDFERYCADCLLKKGFTKAEVTSGSGDHGVDIIAEQNGIRFGIQCKLYQGQIPNKAVQEAYTGASYYDCDVAVIMSNSELTKQAQEEARKLRVKFWNIVNYTSDSEKIAENIERPHTTKITPPKNYEEYIHSQDILDEEVLHKVLEQSKENLSSESKAELAISNLYVSWNFKKAKLLLKSNTSRLIPIIKSINCYCDEVQQLPSDVQKISVLLGKFSYIEELLPTLASVGETLRNIFLNECAEIKRALLCNLKGTKSINADEFNQKYWHARYLYSRFLELGPMLEKLGQSFTDEELAQIYNIEKSRWYDEGSITETAIRDGINDWHRLIYWWNGFLDFIKDERLNIPPYDQYSTIADSIERYKDNLDQIEQRTLRYREYYYIEQQKTIVQKNAERTKRLQEQEELERKQEEQNRIIKEKQAAEKQELERKLKEEQREKHERTLREEQLRKKLLQVILAFISRVAEDKEAEAKLAEKRKRLEEEAGEQIQQAQNQIDEFLRQKNTFSLFRKKRDAELDARIAVLDRHIEQVKQNLADELAKCNQDAEKRKATCIHRL